MFRKKLAAKFRISKVNKDFIKKYFEDNLKFKISVKDKKPILDKMKRGAIAELIITNKKDSKVFYLVSDLDPVILEENINKVLLPKSTSLTKPMPIRTREEQLIFNQLYEMFGKETRIVLHRDNPQIKNIPKGVIILYEVKEGKTVTRQYYLELGVDLEPKEIKTLMENNILWPERAKYNGIIYRG